MNKYIVIAASIVSMAFAPVNAASFNFSSIPNAGIYFNGGGAFGFLNNSSGDSLVITDGSAAGLFGRINGGFSIGSVTVLPFGSTAPVSGTGSFIIEDGSDTFTSDIEWKNVIQTGTGSTINFIGDVNMSNINYSGINTDLLELKEDGAGINTITFQFTNPFNLSVLKNTETITSFSGSVASVNVPDGGGSLALFGLGLIGCGVIRRHA